MKGADDDVGQRPSDEILAELIDSYREIVAMLGGDAYPPALPARAMLMLFEELAELRQKVRAS